MQSCRNVKWFNCLSDNLSVKYMTKKSHCWEFQQQAQFIPVDRFLRCPNQRIAKSVNNTQTNVVNSTTH